MASLEASSTVLSPAWTPHVANLIVSDQLRHLFRRCLKCPSESPSCPPCGKDQTCQLTAQTCDACASTICVPTNSVGGSAPTKHSAPAGAIAGGVIGGLAFICILTYLFWRFCIRNRRKEWDDQVWSDQQSEHESVEKRSQVGLHPDARQSTRSVHSIASTVLTRASNVIQIAYIPGVTNRSPPDTPGLLVPPVPPLPLATVSNTSASSTPHFEQDQHFFMPGDLRDSTWSGYTDSTRHSISPSLARSSVATTIYRNNAVVDPVPAQQVLRGKAVMVRTKSGTTTPSTSNAPAPRLSTPLVPRVPPQPSPGLANSNSPFVGRSVVARPVQVRKTSSNTSVPTMKNLQQAQASKRSSGASHSRGKRINPSISDETSSDEDADPHARSRQSLMGKRPAHESGVTVIDDSPTVGGRTFGDNKDASSSSSVSPDLPLWLPGTPKREDNAGPSHRHKRSNSSLNQLIEDAMSRARDSSYRGLQSVPEHDKKDGGPFSDANEVKE